MQQVIPSTRLVIREISEERNNKRLKHDSCIELIIKILFSEIKTECNIKKRELTQFRFYCLKSMSFFNFKDLTSLIGINKFTYELGIKIVPILSQYHKEDLAFHAAEIGNAPFLKFLLASGVSKNIEHPFRLYCPCSLPGYHTIGDETLLVCAQRNQNENIVRFLTKLGGIADHTWCSSRKHQVSRK